MANINLQNTAKALDIYGKEVVRRAKRNLKIKKKVDGKNVSTENTGKLASSLYYKITRGQTSVNLEFGSSTDYGYFMEKGVQGRLSTYGSVKKYPTGMTKAKFKKKNLPNGVIEDWIRTKKVKLRDKDGKFIPMTKTNIRGASYMIGKSITEKGLGARGFMADAIEETKQRLAISLKDGIVKDLRNAIEIK
jgi:hypothetical protein